MKRPTDPRPPLRPTDPELARAFDAAFASWERHRPDLRDDRPAPEPATDPVFGPLGRREVRHGRP